ncbi:MAG: Holliday junction branch migration protein RuvA [Planctomycetes bacterium]|nr:Holliday junction branch migration protein RuvA [Planctomycetota bacterium]
MYEHLDGLLSRKGATDAVVDVQGLGYRIEISLHTARLLPAEGSRCHVLLHHRIQEDKARLFGFVAEDERELFRELITVPGVGPSTAMTLLSSKPPQELWSLIAGEALKELAKTRGIGPRTAQRVCAELAHKAKRRAAPRPSGPVLSVAAEDAVRALEVLGSSEQQAEKAVAAALAELGPEARVEELVRSALRHL